ncbi:MAG: hypothetical protein NC936_04390 [Candidatus Omnitrophica bacterium]|nr:hypothetical protein [Candidatus Omnitrophota bacterium]
MLLKIKPQAQLLEWQVKTAERILDKTKIPQAAAKFLRDRYQKLNNKLMQKEEKSMALLSEFARRLNIEIISVKPQGKTTLLDEYKEKVEFQGKVCQFIPVSLHMRGFYKDLVKYLDLLDESLPAFFTVEKLQLIRMAPKSPRLDIEMEINIYTLF